MKRRNPRFGCPRIAQHISRAFGLEINKDVVRRVLTMHVRPESRSHGPSGLTFLGQMTDSLWSVDLFRCESIRLKSHWVLVVRDVCTRRIMGFSAAFADIEGGAVCRMFNRAMAGHAPPTHLSSDNDPLFIFHRWQATLRVLDVDEMKTLPLIPCSHPFVEPLIGTIRREYLDDALFWNVDDLTRKLDQFKAYDNEDRIRRSLYATPAQESGKPPPPLRCTRSIGLAPAVSGALSYPNGRLTRNSPLTGYRLIDETGALLAEAEKGQDGSVTLLDHDCQVVKR